VKVLERKLAFVELPVKEYVLYDVLYVGFYALRRRFREDPRRRLHRIGKHENTCFLCLGLRSRVPEVLFINEVKLGVFQFLRLL